MIEMKRVREWIQILIPPLGLMIAVLALIEFLVRFNWVADYILPSPSSVFSSLIEDRSELTTAFVETGSAASLGLLLSFVIGSGLAMLFSVSNLIRRAVYPYAIFFQTVPVVAIAPLLVIWFGFGRPTVIAAAFIVSVFPVIASTLLGLLSTESAYLDLFKLYSASPMDRLFKLRLPFALPQIFSGLRIAAGLAVIGAVVGEFIGGGGLGAVVDAARTQQRIDKVFAAVLISSLLGLILVTVIDTISWYFLRHWHASVRSSNNP